MNPVPPIADFLRRNLTITLAFGIAGLLFLIGTAYAPTFASYDHMRFVLVTASFIGVAGLGQTLCILTGGIDLSIPSTLAGSAVLTAFLAHGDASRLPWIIALIAGLATVVGLINGVAVAYLSVPPIIMTLGMNGALQGLILVYTKGGNSSAPPSSLVKFVNGDPLTIPTDLLIWIGVIVAGAFLLTWTTLGRKLYAIGTNPTAAFLAGVNVKRVLVVPYVLSALGGALAGLLVLGFLGQAFVNMGDEYLFSSAVAVAVGGASILGGNGHYLGTVAGAIILTLIAALLGLFSLGTAALQISYGLILLGTVFVASRIRSSRA